MNSDEEVEEFLNFIVPRPCFESLQSEKLMIENQKNMFRNRLKDLPLTQDLLDRIKQIHYNALMTPGECVGIAGAQSMGEFSTQATLNTFHATGFDSGVNSGVDRFQEIINASKNPKNVECKIFFTKTFSSSTEVKNEMKNKIVGLSLNSLIKNMYMIEKEEHWHQICHIIFSLGPSKLNVDQFYIFRYVLDIQLMFKHFLHPFQIKKSLEAVFTSCIVLFSPFSRRGRYYLDIFIPRTELLTTIRDFYLPKMETICVSGIEGIKDIIIKSVDTGDGSEFMIETLGGSLMDIASIPNVDMFRVLTSSIWDLYNTLGIEAVSQYILDELLKIMNGVQIHNISLLVSRMTFHGTIAGITRYTMRNECGTLSKASFEESMETFIKSAKFGEIDSFKGISAEIIGGLKPSVGTNSFDLKLNFDKIINGS